MHTTFFFFFLNNPLIKIDPLTPISALMGQPYLIGRARMEGGGSQLNRNVYFV